MSSRSVVTTVLALFASSVVACGSTQGGGQPAAQAPGPGAKGACANPYMPVLNGATWTYTVTTNVTGPSTSSSAITAVAADSFTLAVKSPQVSWTETWSCNQNGLLQLQNNGGATGAALAGPDGTVTVTTKSNQGVTVPVAIRPGDTWTQTTVFSMSSSAGVSGTSSTTWTFKAVGTATVTVPAGTFEAMRVDSTAVSAFTFADGKVLNSTSTGSAWWVKSKGMVKGTTTTNVAATDVSYEQDLQSFQIP